MKKATAATFVIATENHAVVDVTLEKVTPRTHKEIGTIRVFLYNDGREPGASYDLFYPENDTEHLKSYRNAREDERSMAIEAAKSWSNTEWGKAILTAHNFTTATTEPQDDDELDLDRFEYAEYLEAHTEFEDESGEPYEHVVSLYDNNARKIADTFVAVEAGGRLRATNIFVTPDDAEWYIVYPKRVGEAILEAVRNHEEPARQATHALAEEYGAAGIAWVREALARAYEAGRKAGEAR